MSLIRNVSSRPVRKEFRYPSLFRVVFLVLALAVVAGLARPDRANAKENPSITDLTIEQLMEIEVVTVYGASKFEQKTTEAPSSVSVVTEADIRNYGYRNLSDILKGVPGFYTTYDRDYAFAGVRGFSRPGDYNTRLLLLVDGHRINDNIYDTAPIGNEFILDVDLIDRVEVIRGPGSSLYGNNAFFGVINVITKKAGQYDGLEVSGEAASFDTYKQRATFGKKFSNGFEMLLSGTNSTSKGQSLYFQEYNSPATNNGRADSCDYEKFRNVFANFKLSDFTLQGAYISREKGVPTGSFGTVFNDSHNRSTDERGYLDLKYNKDLSALTNVKARVFYDYFRYDQNYLFDYPPLTINKDTASGEWWGSDVQLTRTFFGKHKVVVGTEYQNNYLQNQRNYDTNPYVSYLGDTQNSYIWAAHFQDQFSILDNLILNAGVRYDYYKSFGSSTNPRAGLIYSPFQKTTVKLLYGQAFRAPNAYELYYQDGGVTQKANPDLRPEKISTYELVVEQYVRNYRLTGAGYYYRMRDLISLQTDPVSGVSMFQNAGEVEAKGAEFGIEGKWLNGLEGKMSYALQQATDKETGSTLVNSPRQLAKLNLLVPVVPKKLSMGFEAQYTGWRRTVHGDSAGGFVIANLTLLSREIVKNVEVSGSIYNLFDKKYGDPASAEFREHVIHQDGRAFRLKLTCRF